MEIQANTKLFDLLKHYPQLEKEIIGLAPPFKNLKNPVLRRTVARLATVEKIAKIGDLEVNELVNTLRRAVGLKEINSKVTYNVQWKAGEPDWIKDELQYTVNGTEMLSRGEHPMQKVTTLMHSTENGRFLLLITNFQPIPLIEEMEKQKYSVFTKVDERKSDHHYTFIRKN